MTEITYFHTCTFMIIYLNRLYLYLVTEIIVFIYWDYFYANYCRISDVYVSWLFSLTEGNYTCHVFKLNVSC